MAAFEYKCREYFWCVSLMGQFPVILTKDGCFPSRLLRVYGVVLSIVYTGITIYILNNVSVVSGDIFYFVIIRVLPFIGHLLTLHSTLMPSWRANWMCEIFARLNVIDKSLSNFGYEASYFWHRVIPLFVLAIYSAYLGIVVLLEILFPWWIDTFPQYSYYFFWTNYIMFFIMITLIVMIHFIVIRFRFINQKLILLQTASSFIGQKKITNGTKTCFESPPTDEKLQRHRKNCELEDISNKETIRNLQKCHFRLCEISQEVAESFNISVTLIVLFTFIELLVNAYTAFRVVLVSETMDMLAIMTSVKWATVDIVRILSIVSSFTVLEGAANRTATLVSALCLEKREEGIQRQLFMFSKQLNHHKMHFKPWGLFSLNSSMLVSMAGSVTTYLVIILQFAQQNAQKTSGCEKAKA